MVTRLGCEIIECNGTATPTRPVGDVRWRPQLCEAHWEELAALVQGRKGGALVEFVRLAVY